MFTDIRSRMIQSLLFGVMLTASCQISIAAGMAVGKITSVDTKNRTIAIDGISFEIDANKSDISNRISQFKSGQAVQFESDGKKLIRVETVSGGVDFPVLASPPASLKRIPAKP